jgi:hypothetical protein
MKSVIVGAVVLAATPVMAAPVATLSIDVDGDGTADALELDGDGTLHVAAKLRGDVKLGKPVTRAQLAVARPGPSAQILVDATTAAGREAIVVEARGGSWREVQRFPLGGVGLDREYGVEAAATPAGIVRFQSRADVTRCDGKPAFLFAEQLDGTAWKRIDPPMFVAGVPAVAQARVDTAAAAVPLLYQARAASHQAGATDAGGLAIPRELDDGKLETAWREDLPSGGEGQFFTFQPRVPSARAQQLRIVPGLPTSAANMRSFGRPRALVIAAASGTWRTELPDAATAPLGAAYVVDLPQPVDGCITVVLESVYGRAQGTTAIAELEVFAEGERAGGGESLLARLVAEGKDGAVSAAAALARRGAAGATAIDNELAKATEAGARRRLVAALVKIKDPAAAPALVRAATSGWVRDKDLSDLIAALAATNQLQALHDLAGKEDLAVDQRVAAASRISADAQGLPLLLDLAGKGPRGVRHEVIERLAAAPLMTLVQAASTQSDAAASGDLWRAITRRAKTVPADRAAAGAAMLASLASATDYERRYRLVDGVAMHGDAPAIATLDAFLRALPAGTQSAALRQVAIRGLAQNPLPAASTIIVALARDTDPGVRLASVSALASVDVDAAGPWHTTTGPDGIDRVIINGLVGDNWPEVRRRSAVALGSRCQRPGPARSLADAVGTDPEIDVRTDALTALVQCKASGIAPLLQHTWDDGKTPTPVRVHAVGLVVLLGDKPLATSLVQRFTQWRGESLTSTDALALAQASAATIGRLAPPGAAEALIDALDDSAFPEIVASAALGLGALGPACPPAAKAKLTAIARSDEPSSIVAKRAAAQCGR